jgi:hypothetical protein
MRSPCVCASVCVRVSPNFFFVFYAIYVVSGRLMESSCCLHVFPVIFSFSMRSVSFHRNVGDCLLLIQSMYKRKCTNQHVNFSLK